MTIINPSERPEDVWQLLSEVECFLCSNPIGDNSFHIFHESRNEEVFARIRKVKPYVIVEDGPDGPFFLMHTWCWKNLKLVDWVRGITG